LNYYFIKKVLLDLKAPHFVRVAFVVEQDLLMQIWLIRPHILGCESQQPILEQTHLRYLLDK